ncbi:tandem-95 repeat protein [Paenibacillus sp. GYB003]|uniref:tandem-95 repeat protein n=1 Tax=Paenibacillus sp. GYB003 TaxID=2994392 RepID=UPI002F9641F4
MMVSSLKRWVSLMLVWTMAAGLVAAIGPGAAGADGTANANVLANPGFETTAANAAWAGGTGAASWTPYIFAGTPAFAVDQAVYRTGSRSVRISSSSQARGAIYQQTNAVAPGKTYRVSGWMKTEGVSGKALVRIQAGRTSGGNLLVNLAEAKGSTDWTHFAQHVTMPTNATTPAWLKVEAFLENSSGTVWFDDFAVEEWIAAQGVSLNPELLTLQPGETASITANVSPAGASDRRVTWSSSDETVASVSSGGVVTAKGPGFAVIRAVTADGGFTASAVVSIGASATLSASPFSAEIAEDGGAEGRLNATDTSGAPVSFAKATEPAHGKAFVYSDGRFTYYPDANFHGTDKFMYMASNGQGGPRFAVVTVLVTPVNDVPALDLIWYSTGKNKALSDRLQQAADVDHTTLSWSKTAEPEHGTLALNADGTFVYTPRSGFVGYDKFRVAAADGGGGTAEGGVAIVVVPDAEDFVAQFRSRPSYGQHPRLLADKADFDRARAWIESDPNMAGWYERLRQEAEPILQTSPLPYAANGGNNGAIRDRLLRTSLMYQLSGDARYAARTIRELEALAGYADWGGRYNNILAMAELSHAVSLAYDWVYEAMTPAQRDAIAESIRVKVLNVALDWYRGVFRHNGEYNNINLVDNGNFGMAALAIIDASPAAEAAATETLAGMYRKLQQSLRHYTPDGAWPEGPAYWHYGGQYLTYLMASLHNVLGTDYGLSALDGIEQSGDYPYHLLGEGGFFDFYDGGISMAQPESMWFADFFGKPEHAWHLGDLYRRKGVYHPLYLVLYRPGMFDVKPTELDRFYSSIESGSMRSGWDDPDALFASMKGVNETLKSHFDLDAGTFVFDALGVRWAMDTGNESYDLPGFWDYNNQRWTYYRKKTEGHNTIVVNPARHPVVQQEPFGKALRVAGQSKPRGAFSILDMTDMYRDEAVSMKRGMMLAGDRTQLLVQDEMKLKEPSELYWFMHTKASIEIVENGRAAILRQGDKRLYAKLAEAPAGAVFSVMDAEPLPTSPNPEGQSSNFGVRKLTVHLTDVSEANVAVWLVPLYEADPLPATVPAFTPLASWSIPDGELPPRPVRPVLDQITVDGVPLAGFSPKTTYYEAHVPFESTAVPVVGASAAHPFTVVQATGVPGTARIVVQDASNPSNRNAYTVAFKRLPLIGVPPGMPKHAVAGVEASAVPEAAQGNTPDKTIDGDLNTRWSAPGKQWIRYDLGETKPVSAISVAIYNGNTRRAYFDLEASVDGLQWTTLFSGTSSGTTVQPETFLVPTTQARYVRLVGSGNSSNNYNSITEVAMYGPAPVTGVELDRSELLLTSAGERQKLTARVLPDGASDQTVRWTSEHPGIASVDADGTVTAAAEGRTTVTARTEEGGFAASASVVVDLNGPSIALHAPNPVYQNETVALSVYADDAVTGVAFLTVSLDDGAPWRQPTVSLPPLGLSAGEHTVRAVATDRAGHETVRDFRFTVIVTPDRLDEVLDIGFERGLLKNEGILQSLKAKARQIADAAGDPRKLEQALKPFDNEVNAQAGKGIDEAFARLLLADSRSIRDAASNP